MKGDVKTQWVAALRSEKYKQGRGRLRGGGNVFCCLGVLCDILPGVKWDGFRAYIPGSPYPSVASCLPDDIDSLVGWIPDEAVTTLVNMNDTGKSFEEIAYYIEENL